MTRAKRDPRLTLTQNFICGGLTGMFSRTMVSPLEVVKISRQIGTPETRQGLFRTFINLYTEQGIKAFWKGNGVACFRLLPYSYIHFLTYEKLALELVDEQGRMSGSTALLACTGAAICSTFVLYPTDVVIARLVAQHADKNHAKYKGLLHALWTIPKEEGFFRLYRGVSLAILEFIPFSVAVYYTFSTIDRVRDKPKSDISLAEHFTRGCLASACAKMIVFPFDTVMRKMQASSSVQVNGGGVDVVFKGMVDAFRQTWKHHGITGFYRGATAGLLKVVPYSGLMMMSFAYMKRPFLYFNGYTTSPLFEEYSPEVDQSFRPHELEKWYQQKAIKAMTPVLIDD